MYTDVRKTKRVLWEVQIILLKITDWYSETSAESFLGNTRLESCPLLCQPNFSFHGFSQLR